MEKLIKKLLYSLFTIVLAVSALFFIIRLAPGDPVEKILGAEASAIEISDLRSQLGLDKPMLIQYTDFFLSILNGDFGESLFKKKAVSTLLSDHMPATVILAFTSISISAFLGTFLGIWAGYKKKKAFDNVGRIVSLFALSFPIFSLAPLLVLIFSIKLNILPVSEWGSFKHVILPTLTLVIPLSSVLMRVSRNKYLEEVNVPWVQVLEAKGLSQLQILLRVSKVCLPTILNVVAIQLSVVLAGTMITETIFDIPGMGMLLFEGIQNRDYPVVQGVIIYSTVIYMFVYFLVDYLNELIDPRIKS
jgi:peptide/nickel transport system permease protein